MTADTLTPMMKQYRRIRSEMSDDVILFFRLGDFYEMFFEDAKRAAPIMDIALTRRNKVPMCGVPYHALDGYLAKLIRAGCKVAICEQVEDVSAAKGIVRREVTRVVTPGAVLEAGVLDADRPNFLAGICRVGDRFGLALLDLSTGIFRGETAEDADTLKHSLSRWAPTEYVLPEEIAEDPDLKKIFSDLYIQTPVTSCEDWTFAFDAAYDTLTRHFGVHSLEGFGCDNEKSVVGAAGGILYYVREALHRQVDHIRSFQVRQTCDFLVLDDVTCRNLDLLPVSGTRSGPTLLSVLDQTKTAMGARLLRDWMLHPLADLTAIKLRQDAVAAMVEDRRFLQSLQTALSDIRDLERLISRVDSGSGNARDLASIGRSLQSLPNVAKLVEGHPVSGLSDPGTRICSLPELRERIDQSLVDEPPIPVKEGGLIREGLNAQLDEWRQAAKEGRQWLVRYQTEEQERTGIRNLKVRHNKVFGYYIEVTRAQSDHVPDTYIRKQTLVNNERFITPELKAYENKIFGAQEKAMALEYDLFLELRAAVQAETESIQTTAAAIAELDVLASLADRALHLGYVRPEFTDDDTLQIHEGRHPIIEQMPEAERFVPNDTQLDGHENQILIITGPNMAGKSTYIRQVAMIVIMAHMGSFVPARDARMGLVDRVFTRVGASDDLARGRSTFLVEMEETANILNNATSRSLIVLDEIGRGTSTFDGISIAWAVAEYLHTNDRVKAKTLFATHYHELTDLTLTMDGVKNYNILVRETGDRVVFLRKIVPGGADKSYGIQVARLAGLPPAVIDRATEILSNLEEGELAETGQPKIAKRRRKHTPNSAQLDLFG